MRSSRCKMKVNRYSLEMKCIFFKKWKQLAIKELTERCTSSLNSWSLKQNLVMFEILSVTGSEMREAWQNFTPQRNQECCFLKKLLNEIHEFTFVPKRLLHVCLTAVPFQPQVVHWAVTHTLHDRMLIRLWITCTQSSSPTSISRCSKVPMTTAGQAATLWITEKVPHAKRSYWHPPGDQKATWALSRKSKTFSPGYCSHGDDLSHGLFPFSAAHWALVRALLVQTLWDTLAVLPWSPSLEAQRACALMLAEMHTPVWTCPSLPREPQ